MKHRAVIIATLLVSTLGCGTQQLKLEPVKIEPIHMTIDVNLHDDAAKPSVGQEEH